MLSTSKNSNIVVNLQNAQTEVNNSLEALHDVEYSINFESRNILETIDFVQEQDPNLIDQEKELIELERRLIEVEEKYNLSNIKKNLRQAEDNLINLFYSYLATLVELKELDKSTYIEYVEFQETLKINLVERDFFISHLLNIDF